MDITDADLEKIIKDHKDDEIVSINLSHCKNITDEGLKILAHLPLKEIKLRYCQKITNEGLKALGNLPLVELDVSYCKNITDECFKYLVNLPLLESTYISDSGNVTEEAREHFKHLLVINQTDYLKLGSDASKNHDYRDLYNLILKYV